MKTTDSDHFYSATHKKNIFFPFDAQIELTYRCNLNCVHCYCVEEDKGKELGTKEVKIILDDLKKEGCLWLALSGGEPLMRKDFLEIYAYAQKKGFLITLFTNGQLFNKKIN